MSLLWDAAITNIFCLNCDIKLRTTKLRFIGKQCYNEIKITICYNENKRTANSKITRKCY